jgi:hypothetical protein
MLKLQIQFCCAHHGQEQLLYKGTFQISEKFLNYFKSINLARFELIQILYVICGQILDMLLLLACLSSGRNMAHRCIVYRYLWINFDMWIALVFDFYNLICWSNDAHLVATSLFYGYALLINSILILDMCRLVK